MPSILPITLRRAAIALRVPLFVAGCGSAESASSSASATERANAAPTMALVVSPSAAPYRAAAVTAAGRVTGRVPLDAATRVLRDTVTIPEGEERACGAASVTAEVAAVVWIDDMRAGGPLPLERRRSLVLQRCRITPRLSQAWAGDALSIVDRDPVGHHIRITAPERGQTLDVVRTLRDGAVVAVDRALRVPGLLALTCDRHPGERAWVVVTDHPYVAVAGDDGRFTLDSVPAGSWRVVAWHPKGGTFEGRVTVAASGDAEVSLEPRRAARAPAPER